MENRKLYRSDSDKMIAGVCGGLAKYLNLDSSIVRLIFVLLFLFGGHGLLIYLILWIVMPLEVRTVTVSHQSETPSSD
ncbi:MAG: PspC domain-containing protein [Anaerolineae bacterium]|nr:PspC domain-containing protein [Anaerolineae bacterium]